MEQTTISDKFAYIYDEQFQQNKPPLSVIPTIDKENIGDSNTFKDYIFATIYAGSKVNGESVKTLSQAYQFNTYGIVIGMVFMGISFWVGLFGIVHFLLGGIAFSIGLLSAFRLGFYKKLLHYFDLKETILLQAEKFEKEISDDILDPNILPVQVDTISILMRSLTETSSYLDDTLEKLHTSSIFFNNVTYGNIQYFLEKEITGFRKFFTYVLALIQKWLEWHKEELSTTYDTIRSQIEELKMTSPEFAKSLELTNTRLNEHIQSVERVVMKV